MIGTFRKIINPPYSTKELITILATLAILVSIPLTVLITQQVKDFRAKAQTLVVSCQAGPNPFPGQMGTYYTWPVKENSPARLGASVSGGSGSYTYQWYRVPGGTFNGDVGSKTAVGSANPYTFTTPAQGYGWWQFEVKVKDAANGDSQTAQCGFHVLPNPSDRLDPGNLPSETPVLWVPRDAFPGDIVPQGMIDQLNRTLRRVRAAYFEIFGKTYTMNPLQVLVSAQSEADICGGDCTDLGLVDMMAGVVKLETMSFLGCPAGPWGGDICAPYTQGVLVLLWGGGGYAGSFGSDLPTAVTGDWTVASAAGVQTPSLEPNVLWQIWDMNKFPPAASTIGHELNHHLGWDDPHDFGFDVPQTQLEKDITLALPWLFEDLADTESPSVTITSPADGATVSGIINVDVTASDTGGSGVDAVVLTVDDYWYGVDTSAPYTISLDTTEIGHGQRKLTVVVYDNEGHIAESEINVTVENNVDGPCSTAYPVDSGRVCYYDGIGFGGTYLGTLVDPPNLISSNAGWWPRHDFGSGEVAFGKSETISGVWRARLNFPNGRYRFNIFSDDGIRFYVNEVPIIDNWVGGIWAFTPEVSINGYADLRVEWYEDGGDAGLRMLWQPISQLAKTGDLNGDGKVNIFDASIMTSKWGTNDPTADLNGDGTVNIFDASILTANWTG